MDLRAIILDVDGVLTPTAVLHERAWKALFDEVLSRRGDPRPFTSADYRAEVDGKPRGDGIRDFLSSRGLAVSTTEVTALGDRKNALFQQLLVSEGVRPFPEVPAALARWRRRGLRLAAASSSRNARRVLESAGLATEVDLLVDGRALAREGLAGKPAPDLFLLAARRLSVAPDACAVVEDAVSGVEAARRAGVGAALGLSRHGTDQALLRAGAHAVVHSLDEVDRWLAVAPPPEARP